MIKKITVFSIFAVIFTLVSYGHEPEPDTVVCTADLDGDGTVDSLIFDRSVLLLNIKLSSRGYEPFSTFYPGEYENGIEIQACQGGFSATSLHMRAINSDDYVYDPGTGKFRMTGFSHDHMHCGSMRVDLVDGIFNASWHEDSKFVNPDSLVFYPEVEFPVYYDPIYLGEERPDFFSLGYDLLNNLEDIYTPPLTDTVRFIELMWEHDETEPPVWDYPDFIYMDRNGTRHRILSSCEDCGALRDDTVEITTGYIFCHDPQQDLYKVSRAVTDIKCVRPGRFRELRTNFRKEIELYDQARWAESVGDLIEEGVYYYLTVTDNKKILKYLDKPGKLVMVYSDIDRNGFPDSQWRYGIRIDIYNEMKNKRKRIGSVTMGITSDRDFIYQDAD